MALFPGPPEKYIYALEYDLGSLTIAGTIVNDVIIILFSTYKTGVQNDTRVNTGSVYRS